MSGSVFGRIAGNSAAEFRHDRIVRQLGLTLGRSRVLLQPAEAALQRMRADDNQDRVHIDIKR